VLGLVSRLAWCCCAQDGTGCSGIRRADQRADVPWDASLTRGTLAGVLLCGGAQLGADLATLGAQVACTLDVHGVTVTTLSRIGFHSI
jgi:hypothetical protein